MLNQSKTKLREYQNIPAGHIKVLGGPHLAHGSDVAQASFSGLFLAAIAILDKGALRPPV
jgi:hypothetical protein